MAMDSIRVRSRVLGGGGAEDGVCSGAAAGDVAAQSPLLFLSQRYRLPTLQGR